MECYEKWQNIELHHCFVTVLYTEYEGNSLVYSIFWIYMEIYIIVDADNIRLCIERKAGCIG